VNASNSKGYGPNSQEISVTPATSPSAPQNLSAGYGNKTISLTWQAPSGNGGSPITGYRVYRSTTSGSGYSEVAVLGNVTLWTDTGLINGQSYFYVVVAENAEGNSTYSNEASEIPRTTPDAPTNLSASHGDTSVDLTWSAPANGGDPIIKYIIYRSTTSGSGYSNIANTTDATPSYTDNTVLNGVTYYYRVSAFNGEGEGLGSNEDSATPATKPSAPRNLATAHGNMNISLTWVAPLSNGGSPITGYKVYRSLTSGVPIVTPHVTIGNVTSWMDTGLSNGQIYYYVIVAFNAEGDGLVSSEVNATPSTKSSAPNNLNATGSDGQITLTWDYPSSDGGNAVSDYRIFRSLTSSSGFAEIGTSGGFLTYTDGSLTNGVTYYYNIVAININGDGNASLEVSATPVGIPSEPLNVNAAHGNGQVTLSWSVPSNTGGTVIIRYHVYRSDTSGIKGSLIWSSSNGSTFTFVDTTVTNGNTYYYIIVAENNVDFGIDSIQVNATPSKVADPATNLVATNVNGEVFLTWDAPLLNGGASIDGYYVYRSTSSGGPWTGPIATLGVVLNYTDTAIIKGTTYHYVITTRNLNGESINSGEASATPISLPSVPINVNIIGGDNSITLIWDVPVDDGGSTLLDYYIYRSNSSGTGYVKISSNGQSTNFTDTNLINAQTYYYKIAAVNVLGVGSNSSEVFETPGAGPTIPLLFVVKPGIDQIELYWLKPVDDGGYPIEKYLIFRTDSLEGIPVNIANTTSLNYVDSNLGNGKLYYYQVTAISSFGFGQFTPLQEGHTFDVPSQPRNVKARSESGSVKITWDRPTSDGGIPELEYRVYKSSSQDGSYQIIANESNYGFIDTEVVIDNTYYYKITAINDVGESVESTPVEVKVVEETSTSSEETSASITTTTETSETTDTQQGDTGSEVNLEQVIAGLLIILAIFGVGFVVIRRR
jgi:titin